MVMMKDAMKMRWKIQTTSGPHYGDLSFTCSHDDPAEGSIYKLHFKKERYWNAESREEFSYSIEIIFADGQEDAINNRENIVVKMLLDHSALTYQQPTIIGGNSLIFNFKNDDAQEREEVIDLIHQHVNFDNDTLADICCNFGLGGVKTHYDEIIRLVKNNQEERAAFAVKKILSLLKRTLNREPWKLYETILNIAKQFPEQAISLFLLMPPYLEVNLQIGSTHMIGYHHKITNNSPVFETYNHIKIAMDCFEKHIAGICPLQPRSLYPYNIVDLSTHFYNMDQRCNNGLVNALDQFFYLAGLKYIELDEKTRLEYQERQFRLRFITPKLPDNQERLDRLYDELCGNNGMNPRVKNIKGDPDVLLALAKELRELKLQLKQQTDYAQSDFFKQKKDGQDNELNMNEHASSTPNLTGEN